MHNQLATYIETNIKVLYGLLFFHQHDLDIRIQPLGKMLGTLIK